MSSLAVGASERYSRWVKRIPPLGLRTLHWLTVVVPFTFFIAIDAGRQVLFPAAFRDWQGLTILWGGALIAMLTFSKLVFAKIEKLQREILQRNRELHTQHAAAFHQAERLRALHEAGMAVNAERSLGTVLQKVVDLSREMVGARYGAIAVFNEERKIEQFITSGLTAKEKERIGKLPSGLGVIAAVRDEGKPLCISDIRKHRLSFGFPANHPSMKSLLAIPIISKGQVIGHLKLADKKNGEEFNKEDEDRVMMLGAQAAIAIQNAQLYEQEQVLAVHEERERIAQDLHDGIIQDIYAIGLGLEQCIEHVNANPEKVTERLSRTVEALNDIIKDVRNYIFGLQPTTLTGVDLVYGLENVAREFRLNSLIDANLSVTGEVEGILSSEQVCHVLHIAREALTNVLKHTRATSVSIEIGRLEDGLEISIADNGQGFDPSRVSRACFGLNNMAERAKTIGGQLRIDSARDRGSRLTVTIPYSNSEGVETCSTPIIEKKNATRPTIRSEC